MDLIQLFHYWIAVICNLATRFLSNGKSKIFCKITQHSATESEILNFLGEARSNSTIKGSNFMSSELIITRNDSHILNSPWRANHYKGYTSRNDFIKRSNKSYKTNAAVVDKLHSMRFKWQRCCKYLSTRILHALLSTYI